MKASIGGNDDTNLNNEVTLRANHLFSIKCRSSGWEEYCYTP